MVRERCVSLKKMKKAAQEQFEKWDLTMPPLDRMTDGMMIESR